MKKQGFLYGSAILIMSVIITKLIGALFKIPLTNILGGTGMGYFSSAYGIFMPVYAISVTGIPAAIAKMTAENCAIERYSNVKKIHRISLLSFTFIGLILSGIIIVLSVPFCRYVIETPGAFPSVVIIAPSIFFGCVMSVYRGYYEGLRNMYPTAVSQVIEAMIKLIAGLGLCWYTFKLASDCPEKFFHIIKNLGADIVIENGITDISQLIIPYASAAAVLGVTLSSFGGMFFLIIRHKIYVDGITEDQINRDKVTDSKKKILSSLIKIVIPVAIGSLITNLTSLIDLATIIRFMNYAINKAPEIFSISDIPLNETANFYYGSFTGLSVTVFNLIPAFTNMFGKGILPGLTEAWAIKDKEKITK